MFKCFIDLRKKCFCFEEDSRFLETTEILNQL